MGTACECAREQEEEPDPEQGRVQSATDQLFASTFVSRPHIGTAPTTGAMLHKWSGRRVTPCDAAGAEHAGPACDRGASWRTKQGHERRFAEHYG